MLSFLIVSIIFCLLILLSEYFIITSISTITDKILINIPVIGRLYITLLIPIFIDKYIMYDKNIPIGIPINNDLEQVIILSKNIILLNSLLVIPTLFNIANSLLRRNILVVIVLNILVIPISEITVINPYKNIATKVYKDWTSLFSLSKLLIV